MKVYKFNGTNEEFECEEEAMDYLKRLDLSLMIRWMVNSWRCRRR